ncbi:MAG TPA: hypothetical protein VKA46_24290 [Gemmataceae bacterium]|nr:hypothetical protein [Gemmataceae bacterium]
MPPINLHQKVREVLRHTQPPHPEAHCPIQHFERAATTGPGLIKYLSDHIDPARVYPAVYERHMSQLRRMALADAIESFERFLKEVAAVCIDQLAPYVIDDRFDEFMPRGERIAAFVNARSIGKALCESDTWIKNKTINDRFRSLLKEPFGGDWEYLFPKPNQGPAEERDRAKTLAILWQLRHNLAHNVGALTHSDAMKFRLLIGSHVTAEHSLVPTRDDLRFVGRFLSETALRTNERIGLRLATLLTALHQGDATLFDAQDTADEVSRRFNRSLAIDGCAGVL